MQEPSCYNIFVGSRHFHKPGLQESPSQLPVPKDGLRILARIIARHLEKERQQLKQNAITDIAKIADGNFVQQGKNRVSRRHKGPGDG